VADDRLLASVRRELRKRHGFPKGVALRHKGAGSSSQPLKGFHAAKSARQSPPASKVSEQWGVPCVYSLERTDKSNNGPGTLCDRFGTACFATGAFGFAAASQLTTVIARGEKLPKRPRISASVASRGLKQTPESIAPEDATDTPAGSSAEPEAAGGKGTTGGTAASASRRSGDPRMSMGDTGAVASSPGVGESGEDATNPSGCVECDSSQEPAASSPMLFDSHCHAIAEAQSILSGPTCGGLVLMSTGEAEWALAEQVAAASQARHAIGVHPWHLHEQCAGWEERLREALTAQPTAAVGEAGLDRARLDCAWEVQLDAFTAQLRVASDLRRPLVVHCVRSDGAMLNVLREAPALPPTLVMHAFGGSAETARALLSLVGRRASRVFFGFSPGAARLKRAPGVLQAIPAERLLLESDKHTASAACAAVSDACRLVSASRGWSLEETAARTAQNAKDAFSIVGHDAESA
jgi:TatD DNase family protein